MADASEVYKKSDTMHKLEDKMKDMVEEQKALVDPNRKDDDSDHSSEHSSDEDAGANEFTFVSAIDVGSHFIDVNPSEEIKFQVYEGNYHAQFTISNPCKKCPLAYFVYTSSPIPVRILPHCGFIPATFQQVIKIVWEATMAPNAEKLENAMFFVKALPLSPDMDVSKLHRNSNFVDRSHERQP